MRSNRIDHWDDIAATILAKEEKRENQGAGETVAIVLLNTFNTAVITNRTNIEKRVRFCRGLYGSNSIKKVIYLTVDLIAVGEAFKKGHTVIFCYAWDEASIQTPMGMTLRRAINWLQAQVKKTARTIKK